VGKEKLGRVLMGELAVAAEERLVKCLNILLKLVFYFSFDIYFLVSRKTSLSNKGFLVTRTSSKRNKIIKNGMKY